MQTFVAKRVSSENNVLYPDMVEIDNDSIVYYKGYVFGYKTIVINRDSVTSVSLRAGIFFSDVIISSQGGERIIACGFSNSTARQILESLS